MNILGDGLEHRRSFTCDTCGADTNLGDTCEECCTRDCDRCGKLIDFDADIWVRSAGNEDLNIHIQCVQSGDEGHLGG